MPCDVRRTNWPNSRAPLTSDNPRARSEVEKVGGRTILRKVEPIIDVVPALKDLVYDPRMTRPPAQVFGEDVFLFEDKLNYKPPFVGEKYDLHQDYAYWQDFTDRLITVTPLTRRCHTREWLFYVLFQAVTRRA